MYSQFNKEYKNAIYNIGMSGLIGGIGAVIHKDSNINIAKAFIIGFEKASLGGGLIYASKNHLAKYKNDNNYLNIWASKLMFYTGVSIIESAVENKPVYSQFNFNFGFSRFEFNFRKKFSVNYRIMPITFAGFVYSSFKYKLLLKESFYNGTFVFSNSELINNNIGIIDGRNIINNIVIYQEYFYKYFSYRRMLLVHEHIHTFQQGILMPINNYFNIINNNFNLDNNFINKHIYIDANNVLFEGLYLMDSGFFEKEAYYYERL